MCVLSCLIYKKNDDNDDDDDDDVCRWFFRVTVWIVCMVNRRVFTSYLKHWRQSVYNVLKVHANDKASRIEDRRAERGGVLWEGMFPQPPARESGVRGVL